MTRLATDGDALERACWTSFVQREFPSYEHYWLAHVVPLRVPGGIQLRSDADLKIIGKGAADICKAQLHYTVLRHLAHAWEIRNLIAVSENQLTDALLRICSAIDVAFELLQRSLSPGKYDPWLEQAKQKSKGGREARRDWRTAQQYPLQAIYDFRNRLIHGRLLPCAVAPATILIPRIGREAAYMDWRELSGLPERQIAADFVPAGEVVADAWRQVVQYLEAQWRSTLLRGKTLPLPPVVPHLTMQLPLSLSVAVSSSWTISNWKI